MSCPEGNAYLLNTAAAALLVLAAALPFSRPAVAQQPDPPVLQPGYSPALTLDPDAQRQADQIRKEQYKSDTIGQGGNLSLDIGKFVTEPDPIERSMPDVQEDSYTGMRLRLPLRGGRE